MNFCLPYTVSNKFLLRADEIFMPNMSILKKFLNQHRNLSHKCFNIYGLVTDQDINWLNQKNINFKIVITKESPKGIPEKYMGKGIKYYFFNSSFDFIDVFKKCAMGVSDIMIQGDLGFFGDNLKDIKKKYNVNIRTVPYACIHVLDDGLTNFWIRPDDIALYEDVIDYCDILPIEEALRAETLYEIYTHMQDWCFDISDLIVGLNHHINNEIINSEFTRRRVNCQAICHSGKPCNSCSLNIELGKKISKAYFDSLTNY